MRFQRLDSLISRKSSILGVVSDALYWCMGFVVNAKMTEEGITYAGSRVD